MLLAVPWYDHPAWGSIGVAIGIAVFAAGTWIASYFARPRMRIYYRLTGVTPAVPVVPGTGITLVRDGETLVDPYVATLVLDINGRQDIPEGAFSKGEPLVLDVGAPVIHRIEESYEPNPAEKPRIQVDGADVLIGPDLLHRGDRLRVVLLCEGRPQVRKPHRTLVDVRFTDRSPRSRTSGAVGPTLATVGAFGVNLSVAVPEILPLGLATTLLGLFFSWRGSRRDRQETAAE